MRRARVAVQPAVDAHVAEAQRRGEELARRHPVDGAAAVGRDLALARAVGRREGVRRVHVVEPGLAGLQRRHAVRAHGEQVALDDVPELAVDRAVLPREVLADPAREPRAERGDARALVDAAALADVGLLLAVGRDGGDVHGVLITVQELRDLGVAGERRGAARRAAEAIMRRDERRGAGGQGRDAPHAAAAGPVFSTRRFLNI